VGNAGALFIQVLTLFGLRSSRERGGGKFMTRLIRIANKFLTRREEGATLAEYGLLLALIAVVCLAAITLLGSTISSMFASLAGTI
jgi:pilus assembly protein Flp/PilA